MSNVNSLDWSVDWSKIERVLMTTKLDLYKQNLFSCKKFIKNYLRDFIRSTISETVVSKFEIFAVRPS